MPVSPRSCCEKKLASFFISFLLGIVLLGDDVASGATLELFMGLSDWSVLETSRFEWLSSEWMVSRDTSEDRRLSCGGNGRSRLSH